jgi:predicted Rossmann-fold nucleotide-binding protein
LLAILTRHQLGLHEKPVVLLNIDGYWQPVREVFDYVINAGFLGESAHDYCQLVNDVSGALAALGISA